MTFSEFATFHLVDVNVASQCTVKHYFAQTLYILIYQYDIIGQDPSSGPSVVMWCSKRVYDEHISVVKVILNLGGFFYDHTSKYGVVQ